MPTKARILKLIDDNRNELKKLGVSRLGLFGSFVRGLENSLSDIDIIVEFQPGEKSFKNFMSVADYLENLFNTKVELVTPESLSPYLQSKVIEETEYVKVA